LTDTTKEFSELAIKEWASMAILTDDDFSGWVMAREVSNLSSSSDLLLPVVGSVNGRGGIIPNPRPEHLPSRKHQIMNISIARNIIRDVPILLRTERITRKIKPHQDKTESITHQVVIFYISIL
jgi:hypothetical protein